LPRAAVQYRFGLYAALNLGFLLLMGIAVAISGMDNARFVYLLLLFALCSTLVIDLDGLNGRYSLLAIFMLAYFVFYGVGDLTVLMFARVTEATESAVTMTEAVILVGGVMLVLGYRLAVWAMEQRRPRPEAKDWSLSAALIVGLILWAIGTYATYRWYVVIITDTTNETVRKGLNSMSTLSATLYILAQMVQPLGILLLVYVYRVSRRAYMLPLIIGIVILQVALGFVVDIKGLAMLAGVIVILSSVLIEGRLPKVWVAAAVAFIILGFPILQTYRAEVRGNRGLTPAAVIQNFRKTLDIVLSAEKKVNEGRDRAQTFLERASLKGSVQMIVKGTANGVAFQHGYTLTPIVAAFVPHLVWAEKVDVPTGQLVNKAFHVSDSDNVYISPSHLGELYWNFGWPGVVLGMTIIGLTCGYIGAGFNLRDFRTVTRLLVTVATIRLLIWGFEGGIAAIYVVWIRSVAGIGVLHLLFARVRVSPRWAQSPNSAALAADADQPRSDRRYPNLLT
jgi:O-antigen polysaccharide polymerase Wzy